MKTLKKILLSGILGIVTALSSCNILDFVKRDNQYNGVVLFMYDNEKFTQERRTEIEKRLTLTFDENLSLEDWFDKQAEKYDAQIDIPLYFYPEQIQIPEEFLVRENIPFYDSYTDISLWGLTNYLRTEHSWINEYDFISIIQNNKRDDGKEGGGLAYSNLSSFFIGEGGHFSSNYAHEFLHLLRAKHLDLPNNIMNPTGYGGYLDDKVQIAEETAREIGWLK